MAEKDKWEEKWNDISNLEIKFEFAKQLLIKIRDGLDDGSLTSEMVLDICHKGLEKL